MRNSTEDMGIKQLCWAMFLILLATGGTCGTMIIAQGEKIERTTNRIERMEEAYRCLNITVEELKQEVRQRN